jgi:hypothetical protein
MQADEVVLIRCYDSALAGAQLFSAHTGFDDPTTPLDAPPRQSIECACWCSSRPASPVARRGHRDRRAAAKAEPVRAEGKETEY